MKGKIKNITRSMPHIVRITPEEYPKYADIMAQKGITIPTWEGLGEIYGDRSKLRLVVNPGRVVVQYTNVAYVFRIGTGYIYNTASVPDLLKFAKDNDALDMDTMSLPHDGVYLTHCMPKEDIDKIFVDGIEYYHDQQEADGTFARILENIKEDGIEAAIEFAFGTDIAHENWESKPEVQEMARKWFTLEIIQKGVTPHRKPQRPQLVPNCPLFMQTPAVKKAPPMQAAIPPKKEESSKPAAKKATKKATKKVAKKSAK